MPRRFTTGFLKQGKASCGVGRQYTGSAGKITNCQIGVFAAYASRHGHAFVDRALYLPKAWTDDPARMAAAHVPDDVRFATKPKLAAAMIDRATAAQMPFAWVAADTVYGTGDIEMALRRAGKGYVLGTNANHPFHSWGKERLVSGTAEAIARELPGTAWTRLSAGEGTKGARLHDWHYLELADLDARQFDGPPGPWTRGLLVRRCIADGSMAFFSTWCPLGTPLETLVAVEGRRWAIEDAFETAKNELGLDHNETRSWHGWHRHVSLVITAFAMLAAIRHHANATPPPPPPKKDRRRRPARVAPDPLVDAGDLAKPNISLLAQEFVRELVAPRFQVVLARHSRSQTALLAQVVAQRRSAVMPPQQAALLQARNHQLNEIRERVGQECR